MSREVVMIKRFSRDSRRDNYVGCKYDEQLMENTERRSDLIFKVKFARFSLMRGKLHSDKVPAFSFMKPALELL